MKLCIFSDAEDQKTLIKHCAHQSFEWLSYGSNRKSRTYIYVLDISRTITQDISLRQLKTYNP